MKHYKLLLLATFFILTLSSCDKKYQYEVYAETGLVPRINDTKINAQIIKAPNDSVAFVRAHSYFLISMNLRFKHIDNFRPEKHYFKLITPNGLNISSGSFLNNPNKIIQFNADCWLSKEFKEYIYNLEK